MTHDVLIAEVEAWLLDKALHDPDIVQLFDKLCVRLRGIGIPLDRAALSWPTLHPLFQAEQIHWRRDEGVEFYQHPHFAEPTAVFLASPFNHVIQNRLERLRRPLAGPNALVDFDVLRELQAKGFTDYLLTTTNFAIARVRDYRGGKVGIMASWSTRRDLGFSEADITTLSRVQKVFAVTCHAAIQRRVMEALGEAYLGPTAARRVFEGDSKLGDGEVIRAVVWYSDLRGSTALSSLMEPHAYLDYLRAYYACTAGPVIAEGGEVLDYIGDGVLAIFPLKGDIGGPEAVRAATRAMEASLDLLATYRAGEGAAEMQYSIALALGDMMFGNIGVPSRLSFSAIGAVVNAVTKIEKLTKEVGRAVLVTADIATVEPDRWTMIGHHAVTGLGPAEALYARACVRDAFDDAGFTDRLSSRLAG